MNQSDIAKLIEQAPELKVEWIEEEYQEGKAQFAASNAESPVYPMECVEGHWSLKDPKTGKEVCLSDSSELLEYLSDYIEFKQGND